MRKSFLPLWYYHPDYTFPHNFMLICVFNPYNHYDLCSTLIIIMMMVMLIAHLSSQSSKWLTLEQLPSVDMLRVSSFHSYFFGSNFVRSNFILVYRNIQ